MAHLTRRCESCDEREIHVVTGCSGSLETVGGKIMRDGGGPVNVACIPIFFKKWRYPYEFSVKIFLTMRSK
jgi:hypothetical protein